MHKMRKDREKSGLSLRGEMIHQCDRRLSRAECSNLDSYFSSASASISLIGASLCLMLATVEALAYIPQDTNSVLVSQYQVGSRCPPGPPLQWRPHLDAAGKAYLSPIVALATLQSVNLSPSPVTVNSGLSHHQQQQQHQQLHQYQQQQQQQQLHSSAYHPQNINNAGMNIETTFQITKVLKNPNKTSLEPKQIVKLFYKISPWLSSNMDLMSSLNVTSRVAGSTSVIESISSNFEQKRRRAEAVNCALELSEHELLRKANKIFIHNQKYILYLDQNSARVSEPSLARASQYRPPTGATYLNPFASHEMLTNQTVLALSRTLCSNCGKFQWAR